MDLIGRTLVERPPPYVLIDGDEIYDVRFIGEGPFFYACERTLRPPPVPPSRISRWISGAFDRYWRLRVRLEERYGQRCRVLARGSKNSALIEFEDGQRYCVSRNAYRKIPEAVVSSAPAR